MPVTAEELGEELGVPVGSTEQVAEQPEASEETEVSVGDGLSLSEAEMQALDHFSAQMERLRKFSSYSS
jgi:prefoldin subunit 5